MKNIFATLIIVSTITILLFTCQDNYLTDLTPDSPQRDHFYFDSPSFAKAIMEVNEVDPDTAYQIDQPDCLIDRSPFTYDRSWYTTDTFAFDPEDFDPVLDVLISTAQAHQVVTSYPSSDLAWITISGRGAYSKAGEYWLIPYFTDPGGRFFIQVSRNGSYWMKTYTANAVWMEAKQKDPKGDVS